MIDKEIFKTRIKILTGEVEPARFAKQIGCDPKTIRLALDGKIPGIDILSKIAEGRTTVGWLLGETDDIKSAPLIRNDQEISESAAIEMTKNVIRSKTVFRGALWENLKAFSQAVEGEEKMKSRDEMMERMMQKIESLEKAVLSDKAERFESEKKQAGNSH